MTFNVFIQKFPSKIKSLCNKRHREKVARSWSVHRMVWSKLEEVSGAWRIQAGAQRTHRAQRTQIPPAVQILNQHGAHPERGALGFARGA